MPNFDTGHYFLTTLAPIKNGTALDDRGVCVSYAQRVRTLLAILPTALQSPATEKIGINSPFADNRRTHLCRFMVLDDAVYNGRNPKDAIATALVGKDPIIPQEVDRLNCPYLMFVADFDAVMEEGDPLPAALSEAEQDKVRDAYARRLWETMQSELCEIYSNCTGFETVKDADGFADYIRRCQVETTMPFNDYWLNPPKLNDLSIGRILALVGIPLLVLLLSVIGICPWFYDIPVLGGVLRSLLGWTSWWTVLGGLLATALGIWLAYRYALKNGQLPMPPGEYADLPSVLKSLYLQQTFSEFAISAQGKSDAQLHEDFGAFLKKHKPEDKMAPSQAPGVISISRDKAIVK